MIMSTKIFNIITYEMRIYIFYRLLEQNPSSAYTRQLDPDHTIELGMLETFFCEM